MSSKLFTILFFVLITFCVSSKLRKTKCVALDGDCDFNIVIRTALHKDGMYYLGVGGGITAESDLEFEYEETLQKAKAVLEAMK